MKSQCCNAEIAYEIDEQAHCLECGRSFPDPTPPTSTEVEPIDPETLDKMNLEAKFFDMEYPNAPHWVRFQAYFNIMVKHLGIKRAEELNHGQK